MKEIAGRDPSISGCMMADRRQVGSNLWQKVDQEAQNPSDDGSRGAGAASGLADPSGIADPAAPERIRLMRDPRRFDASRDARLQAGKLSRKSLTWPAFRLPGSRRRDLSRAARGLARISDRAAIVGRDRRMGRSVNRAEMGFFRAGLSACRGGGGCRLPSAMSICKGRGTRAGTGHAIQGASSGVFA